MEEGSNEIWDKAETSTYLTCFLLQILGVVIVDLWLKHLHGLEFSSSTSL